MRIVSRWMWSVSLGGMLLFFCAVGCGDAPPVQSHDADVGHEPDASFDATLDAEGHHQGDPNEGDVDADLDGLLCHPSAELDETCDGIDDDCDGVLDEDVSPPLADLQQGVCLGSLKICAGTAGYEEPDYGEVEAHQADEGPCGAVGRVCDGLDNDCDGLTDEVVMLDVPYHSQLSETPSGVYSACMPTCLLMVAESLGFDIELGQLMAYAARIPIDEGGYDWTCSANPVCTSAPALERVAREDLGLILDAGDGWTLDDLHCALLRGQPVIVMVTLHFVPGGVGGHAVVIDGVDLGARLLYLQDPWDGPDSVLDLDQFLGAWAGPVDVGDPLQPEGHRNYAMTVTPVEEPSDSVIDACELSGSVDACSTVDSNWLARCELEHWDYCPLGCAGDPAVCLLPFETEEIDTLCDDGNALLETGSACGAQGWIVDCMAREGRRCLQGCVTAAMSPSAEQLARCREEGYTPSPDAPPPPPEDVNDLCILEYGYLDTCHDEFLLNCREARWDYCPFGCNDVSDVHDGCSMP